MAGVVINGKIRNYASIRVTAFGALLTTVKAISYDRTDAVDGVKACGTSKDIGYTQGDEKYTGSITLLTEEVDAFQKQLPKGKSIQDIPPFPITVTYVGDNGIQVAHALIGCKFTKNGRSGEAGSNDALSVEIPLYIADIDWDA